MLKALVGMILKGPDVIEGSAERSLQDQAILTISQLLIFNNKKTASTARLQRHNTDKETLLSVHFGIRKKGLVELLHILGLGISYKRVYCLSQTTLEIPCAANLRRIEWLHPLLAAVHRLPVQSWISRKLFQIWKPAMATISVQAWRVENRKKSRSHLLLNITGQKYSNPSIAWTVLFWKCTGCFWARWPWYLTWWPDSLPHVWRSRRYDWSWQSAECRR